MKKVTLLKKGLSAVLAGTMVLGLQPAQAVLAGIRRTMAATRV